MQASNFRHLVFKLVLYSSKQFVGDIQMNAFRCLHPILKTPDFGNRALTDLELTPAVFDNVSKDLVIMFNKSLKEQDWNVFVNACACSVALVDAFENRGKDFTELIPDIIDVVKDKTDVVRKNAAIFLAKLARDAEVKEEIRKHHGMDVLLSLRAAF